MKIMDKIIKIMKNNGNLRNDKKMRKKMQTVRNSIQFVVGSSPSCGGRF